MLSKSESLFNRAKNVIPYGVNSPVRFYEPYPFFAISANGSKIVTADHKICIDYCMGYGAVLLGHAYQAVTESIKNQLDIGNLYCVPTEKEVKLAELIAEVVPCAEMTRLVTTGAEATMNAIRLARAFTNKGLVLPEKEYLNDVRKITQENDVILIFDEVVTGFRLALGGASEFFGIMPDLVTFAKALGNGLPIAAIAGKKEIMNKLAPAGSVYQASTFAGNPVSVAAGIATLETLTEAKNTIYPRIAKTCDSIVGGIKDILTRAQLDCTVNSIGSMFQLFFTSERVKDQSGAKKANARMCRKLFDELLKQDIFIPPPHFETCFLSYAHTEDDADKTIEAYDKAFHEIKK